MSTVELRHGDLFDGPSDLIVLPCSTAGTFTALVAEKLVHYNIPHPRSGMSLGELSVLPFKGGENIAQFVAFAASVTAWFTSSLECIHQIAYSLGLETQRNPAVRRIAAPLLGTGAGGLSHTRVAEYLRDGFSTTAHKDATLTLSVLDETIFELVRLGGGSRRPMQPPQDRQLRVFISYSHGSAEENRWIVELATYLRENGIEARLDVWHLRRGMDMPQFMTNELALADRVILVSDERYAEKADKRVGGVGWETMIVQGDIYALPPDSTKYVVIVRSPSVAAGLPLYLKSKFVLHWPGEPDHEHHRKVLLQELFEIPLAPPVRPRPVLL
ncbi:MAG TPA: TIR domain-containing protein [Kofleriaceae bacterium]|nr:TIR domain-containing protein [Kofleriaceae bacterium]